MSTTGTDKPDETSATEPLGPDEVSSDGPAEFSSTYRWIVMGVTVIATFAMVLDTTIVNIGLPAIQREFGSPDSAELGNIEWVLTAYLAAVGIGQMLTGWLTDRFGRKRCFVGAFGTFTVASALCALAPTLGFLVAARILQGLGGGLLMPVAMAMIYALFPASERGRALGMFGIAVMAAPAIGPVLGGWITSSFGWRWIFSVNVPVGLIGVPLAIAMLRSDPGDPKRELDTVGLVLSTVGLSLLMIGFAQGEKSWVSLTTIGCLAAGVGLLVAFALHSLRTPVPLVELRVFANPVFSLAMVILGLMAVAQYARLVYIPLELSHIWGLAESKIGLVMLPSALGMAVTMPIGGRIVDRLGARIPVGVGCSIFALSYLGLVFFVSEGTSQWVVSGWLGLGGLGGGLAMMAPNIQALNSVKSSLVSQATGLSSVTRQISTAVGVAVLSSIFGSAVMSAPGGRNDIGPYRLMFMIGAALFVVCAVLGQFLPNRTRARELQLDRQAEAEEFAFMAAEVG